MDYFTVDKLGERFTTMLSSTVILLIMAIPCIVIAKVVYKKDAFLRKIATYGLMSSNFGYMGLAVMEGAFPDVFAEYTVFIIPHYIQIYAFLIPMLLIPGKDGDEKFSIKSLGGRLLNPLLIAMLVGMVIGITGIGYVLPLSVKKIFSGLGGCMSPMAMLLSGMILAGCSLKNVLKSWHLYFISFVRLIAIPIVAIAVLALLPKGEILTREFIICVVCAAAMPLGMNAIVIPSGYGNDSPDAAGMTLISHLFSVATIPLMFSLMNIWVL